jgi:4,5-DOPA dioxygenase extradiol
MNAMPAIFFGHGNPMNALLDNEYTRAWKAIGSSLPPPTAYPAAGDLTLAYEVQELLAPASVELDTEEWGTSTRTRGATT